MALISPLIAAYLTQRYMSGKSKPGWGERWGNLPDELHARPNSRPRVWVHAVSAGEVVAAVPILRELRTLLPDHDIVLSVITPAGHEMAEQQALPFLDSLFYFPIDLPWVARRVVEIIQPRVFVSLESDMWPNLLHELKRHGCRTVMVNGRISEHSFQRTRKIAGSLYRWMLSNMDRLLMQSALDAQRVRELGNLTEPGRVAVLGNSKFDQEITRLSPQQTLALRRSLRLPDEAPVFVAGSTRSAEEEAEVIAAYKTMRVQVPDLCLIIAPRYVDRASELAEAMRAAGLSPLRRSEMKTEGEREKKEEQKKRRKEEEQVNLQEPNSETGVSLILDTMGELANVYAVAAFAFVGNSFPPVTKGGGQNLLQPLAHGKAALFGPHTATTRSEVALTTEAGVGFQVADGAELAQKGLELLTDADLRTEISAHAIDLIAANKGVSLRYAEIVAEMTRENTPPFEAAPVLALKGGGRA